MPETPYYLLDEAKLISNICMLKDVMDNSGAKILLALKGYAFYPSFHLLDSLSGVCASGLYEARLGSEEFRDKYGADKIIFTYSPAFKDEDIPALERFSTHLSFNSLAQFLRFQASLPALELGLRVNLEYSEVANPLYNPAAPFSRLGINIKNFNEILNNGVALERLNGLHFHTHCEQDSYALERSLKHFDKHFGIHLHKFKALRWLNLGGGHHITKYSYDRVHLINLLRKYRERYGLSIILEPGEAVALNAGYLVSSVLDIINNERDIAILDSSACTHMPDVIEAPFTPEIKGARIFNGANANGRYLYRLGGPSCLAGDVMGDYVFRSPLTIGTKLMFKDALHYSIVKNTTFNGIPLPSLVTLRDGKYQLIKQFAYEDYKSRNG